MAGKKTKKRRKPKKIRPKGFLLKLSVILGIATLFGLFYYLFPSRKTTLSPVYEEIEAINTDYNKAIVEIDHVIYDSLYQKGISEKNVLFLSVKPQHEGGNTWDFTELLIKIPDKGSALQLERKVDKALFRLRPNVKYILEKISMSESVFKIFTMGLYSHKIKLAWKNHYELHRGGLPRIAIIIDDLGYDPHIVAPFIHLDLPLAFSILPIAPYSRSIANEVRNKGHELILHLPMEPNNFPRANPGPGALLTGMSDQQIQKTLDSDLKSVSGIQGVNNHMGSYFSAKEDKMAVVMRELKKRNLFYVDSRTTTKTVAHKLAKKMGVPVASRSVFLDNNLSPKAIGFQMERLMAIARQSGVAIGIGHPYKETLAILNKYLKRLKSEVEVVPVSELVD